MRNIDEIEYEAIGTKHGLLCYFTFTIRENEDEFFDSYFNK